MPKSRPEPRSFTPGAAPVRLALLALACLLGLAQAGPAAAASVGEGRRVVLLLLDGVGLSDLAASDMPNFRRLLVRQGAIASANARPAGAYTPESGYVGLGAGTRAYGTPDAGLTLGTDELHDGEPAGTLFARNTGRPAPAGALVHLDLPRLLAQNAKADHPVQVGALGEALRAAGRKVAVVGQADSPGVISRLAGTVAMDARGVVPRGNVSQGLSRPDPLFPTGRRTDYDRLLAEFRRFYRTSDLVVIETGDTARLNRTLDWVLPEQAARLKQQSLKRFDAFLGELSRALDWKRTLVLLVSPGPAPDAVARGELLTFVAAFGPEVRPGLLQSSTTRRPGLVTAFDVAPTILSWLDAPVPATMIGRPVAAYPFPDPLPALLDFERLATATNRQRPPVLKGYVVLQIIFILGSLVALFLAPRLPAAMAAALRLGLLGLTAAPLAMLFLPLIRSGVLGLDVLLLVSLTVLCVAAALLGGRSLHRAFVVVYLATAAALLVDVSFGARLIRSSFLGYDPLGGSRYYGIGNEYMGVLFGATVAGCAAVLDLVPALRPHWRLVVLTPLTLAALITGFTGFGANFGGLLGGVVTLLAAWLAFRGQRPRLATLGLLAATGAALVAGVAVADALRPQETSHVGQLVRQVAVVGPEAFYTVVARKLAMNFRLMRYTPWADGLVTFIIGLGVLLYRPVGLLSRIVRENPSFSLGFWAALAGTVAVFLLNDSGVVAAATLMLYPTALLLDLALWTAFSDPKAPPN